eukprot:7854228-Lingulodinium_polyedra.AAC.1
MCIRDRIPTNASQCHGSNLEPLAAAGTGGPDLLAIQMRLARLDKNGPAAPPHRPQRRPPAATAA